MLNSLKRLHGVSIEATDGFVGEVKEAYFDDERWTIRYLVVETGNWLNERRVLISPYSVEHPPLQPVSAIKVKLSRQQVKDSPDIDTHKPISRRHEQAVLDYYAYPDYWGGVGLWAMGGFPILEPMAPSAVLDARHLREPDKVLPEDVHLRSSAHVTGYSIQAIDGAIGHVKDFIFDDESWALRYLLVDTRDWWPGGRHVLIAVAWIDDIDWNEHKVSVQLTRDQIRNSPAYDEDKLIDRSYEERLHASYARKGYWD